jgi:pimeloyl-ACP methyl ester carboxylesterase
MPKPSTLARHVIVPLQRGEMSIAVSFAGRPTDPKRPRLLLVHGNPADMDDWGELVEELGESADVVTVDLPGFGKSGSLSGQGAGLLDVFADSLEAAIRFAGWPAPYTMVGHSHGGGVALTVAARHPDSVDGLVLLSTLGVPAHASYRQLALPGVHGALRLASGLTRARAGRRLMRSVVGAIVGPLFHPTTVPESIIDEQLRRFVDRPETLSNMALLARGDPCRRLARDAERVRAPTFFLHGDADRVVPLAHVDALAALIAPHAPTRFELLPGAGHMLHRTHAADVAACLHRWLRARGTVTDRKPHAR